VGKREDYIEEEVLKVCENYFCKGNFIGGQKILQKLFYAHYDKLDNMITKRNLLYRLVVAERRCKNENGVELYVRKLKEDMDNTPNYKEECMGDYLSMMSYYTDCEGIKLTIDELIEYYDFSYNYNKKVYELNNSIDSYIKMKIAIFNKARVQKNFHNILKIIEDIHNINDAKAISTLEQMLCDVKKIDKDLYNKALDITNIIVQVM
jgi:hypothetical protein